MTKKTNLLRHSASNVLTPLPLKRFTIFSLFLLIFLSFTQEVKSQTDFAPGEIMFVGYRSDAPDSFSIVLLKDLVANTVILITDRGWSNTTGFRTGNIAVEGTISLTFTANQSCGKEIIFAVNTAPAPDVWTAIDATGASMGTVAITTGTNGPVIDDANGDQLFIYQTPAPTSGSQGSFVTAISMDVVGGSPWAANATTDANSALPNGLNVAQVVGFNTEYDNAKYDCSPFSGTSLELQLAINNDNGFGVLTLDGANNWNENNTGGSIQIKPSCSFCCSSTGFPNLSGPSMANTNSSITISISGTLPMGESWQLFTAGCGVGSPLQTTTGNSFNVTGPATAQSVTYYVRSSGTLDCPGLCGQLTVCFQTDIYATCTTCGADPSACGVCYLPSPAANPTPSIGCYAMSIAFVLDESGSIGSNASDVEDGVLAFLNALNGQDAQVALIEFDDLATVVNGYTVVNQTYIDAIEGYFNGAPYNGQTYSPGGSTNWHDAMKKVDALTPPDVVIFFTDGVPTAWTNLSNNADYCGDGSTTQTPEIVNPVKLANKIKGEGTHMFMLGVGTGINSTNLQQMSGYVQYVSGTNSLLTADYSIGNFNSLAEDLANFIEELCRTTIITTKEVLGPICNGQVQFRFRIINTGTESAATNVILTDTFPVGYDNPTYMGPSIKICFEGGCDPAQPNNAFQWIPFSVPPQDTVELILTVDVLTGNHVNTSWVTADNADGVHATFNGVLTQNQPPVITCPANVTIECTASTLPANTGTATATDPDGTPAITYTDVTVSTPCPFLSTITRTWSANDGCNPAVLCQQTIKRIDTTPPTITCPGNVTLACGGNTAPAVTGTATGVDACDPTVAISFSDATVAGSCPAAPIIQRTWTAADDCGNISTCLQNITLTDTEPPVITCMNIIISCSASSDPSNTGYPNVTNNCGGTSVFTYVDVYIFMGTFPECSIERTWTATDNCGNSATCLQTIILKDLVLPTIFCPANVTIACSANTLPANTGSATATDNCAVAPTIAYADNVEVSPTCPQNKTITRTWTTFDECGNSNSCVQVVTVVDNIAPTITCPANITVLCDASTLPANTGSPSSNDNCDVTPTITFTDVSVAGTCPQKYTITRSWKSTDDCGNFSTCNQSISVTDNLGPLVTCPANITILCSASTLPANTGSATATDNCSAPVITYTDVTAAGTCPQSYTITRTWKGTDACGNFTNCNQTIFIQDNLAPTITCPANITILCTASTLPANTGNPTSSDNCDLSPTISFTDVTVAGGCPQAYTITRTWKSLDHCGNFINCVQTITVIDNVAPSLTCPANLTIQCTASTLPSNTGNPSSTDNCDLTPTITYTDVTVGGACPQEYTITRTWKTTDDCSNSTTCVQTIVVDDSTNPVLTCPANITIQCTASTLPANTGNPTSSDNCDATPTVTYTDVTVAGACPQEYTITRTWKSTDDCENSSTCNQVITVDDSMAPTITCPANLTLQCTESTLPPATGSMTASDNCDPNPMVNYADVTTASPNCPQEFSIARTWTASDICGNITTCLQSIIIVDDTPPNIVCPVDITILCTASTLPSNTGEATATDICDPSPNVEYFDITMSVQGSDGYLIQRLWTATDACGNDGTCTQNILVNNPLNPEIVGDPFDTICSGQMVTFQAVNQGIDPTTYQWSFGSGSNPSSATGIGPHTITYTYNTLNGSVGAWVVLTVSTPGCPPVTDTVANINVNALPNSAITATPPGDPCVFGSKTFQPTAAQVSGYTYLWNFGAGALPATGNGYGPYTVEYSTAGVKTVKLKVFTNEAGASCADSSMVSFTVNPCPGTITGRVFLDTNTSDTIGISATVRLFADQNLDGLADNAVIIRSVSTNAQGRYSMASITPGYYVIIETQPAGYFSLWEDDTSEDYDSLSNLVPNDNIIPVTIESSELDTRNFFSEVISPGIISGFVFEDFNGDEAPQPAEGIPGVTVRLHADTNADGHADGAPVATVVTNNIGFYTIGGMAIGNYVLVEVQPAGYNSILDDDPTADGDVVPNTNMMNDTIPVSLANAETDAENFFIDATPCSQFVTTAEDNVPGCLRFAIECAQDWDTIYFHPTLANQIIHINAGRIEINKNLYIYSNINPTVDVKSDVSGAFMIAAGNTVEMKGIIFTSGLSGSLGAQFENYGHLILWDSQVYRNALLAPNEYLIYNHSPGDITTRGTFQLHND